MVERALAGLRGLPVPTIQRMEASEAVIRGNADSLMRHVPALATPGFEQISKSAVLPSCERGAWLKSWLNRGRIHPGNHPEESAHSIRARG
jgi:hypothetical protein